MSIKMSGMISGMDTDSIVKELMKAQQGKVTKLKNKRTKLDWKQDKWKELNTKLQKLYKEQLSDMRMQGSYLTKKVTSNNSSAVTVTGNANAPDGTHEVIVNQLASAQYWTSGKFNYSTTDADGKVHNGATESTKLSDLDANFKRGTTYTITSGTKTVEFKLETGNETINDFTKACKSAGIKANFDVNQQRLFLSSAESGATKGFTITAGFDPSAGSEYDIKKAVGYTEANKAQVDLLLADLKSGDTTKVDNAKATLVQMSKDKLTTEFDKEAKDNIKIEMGTVVPPETVSPGNKIVNDTWVSEMRRLYNDNTSTDEELLAYSVSKVKTDHGETALNYVQAKQKVAIDTALADKFTDYKNDTSANGYDAQLNAVMTPLITKMNTALNDYANPSSSGTESNKAMEALGFDKADAKKIASADSEIEYNGVKLTGSTNVISVNGLTITASGVTKGTPTEKVNLTVTNDTDAVYNKVKKFIKEYNSVLDSINELYGAKTAKGYEPLTDEEKDAMTDKQIEDWEKKIKDASLRRDDTIDGIAATMRTALLGAVEVDGKKYTLSSFGIQTSDINYMSEKGQLHIYGDKDDATYSGYDDKLKAALEQNPDTVGKVLSGLIGNLYNEMYEKQETIVNVRSSGNFYNDHIIKNELSDYDKKIKEMDKKLQKLEDRYYKQFSAMEVAMSKMQKQQDALSGMLAGGM